MNSLELANSIQMIRDILFVVHRDGGSPETVIELVCKNTGRVSTEVEVAFRLAKRFKFIDINDQNNISVTDAGKSFDNFLSTLPKHTEQKSNNENISINFTIPPSASPLPIELSAGVKTTTTAIKDVIATAEEFLYVVSPFLDPGILQMLFEATPKKPNCKIYILTSDPNLSGRFPYRLKELFKFIKARFHSGEIHFLDEQMSIAHAKIFCSEKSMVASSANLKKDSMSENFEAGLYTETEEIIEVAKKMINHVIKTSAIQLDP